MPLTSVGLVNSLPFLSVDSLLALRLVSRGCRIAVQHEMDDQSRLDQVIGMKEMPDWHTWEGVMERATAAPSWCVRHLLRHVFDSIREAGDRTQHDYRRRLSAMELPGMPTQDPLDELNVEWGAVFPSRQSRGATTSIEIEWWKRSSWRFEADDGAHGRWYLGIGSSSSESASELAHTCVSFAVLVYSSTGSIFCMAISLLFLGDQFCDLYWHFSINPEDVTVLQRRRTSTFTLNGNESIISSHPQLFGHWFTAAVPNSKDVSSSPPPSRMPVSNLIPFSLLAAASPPATSLAQIFSLAQNITAGPPPRTAFASYVEDMYLLPISKLLDDYEGNVFTIREEFAEMVTPKGVWTYPTGSALVEGVNAKKLWTLRRDRLLQQIGRSAKKGMGDMFSNGWVPIGLLTTLSNSQHTL